MFYNQAVIKHGSQDDAQRMMARLEAEQSRPMDDHAQIRDFPKYGRPLVQVGEVFGKAVAWTPRYGLVEWLDSSGKYRIGWAHASSIKRVKADEWHGSSGL